MKTEYDNQHHKTDRDEVIHLLRSQGNALEELYRRADAVRQQFMHNEVFIRGIVEFSNVCARNCYYCGIRTDNERIKRYTMSTDEIMEVVRHFPINGQGTVVLQSGEVTTAFGDKALGKLIRRIKHETPVAVTVSVGNRPRDVYQYWYDCGMDRYLIRFETSDPNLYARLHPDSSLAKRLDCIKTLSNIGVQTGSGFMIGVPDETVEILANNILLCRELDLDMIGIGPFIPHPDTPLGNTPNAYASDPEMFFKALAVLRLFNPNVHIPATTAYDAAFYNTGRDLALQRGANVFMPNATPNRYRNDYLLYPGKPCVDKSNDQCGVCVIHRIQALERILGQGPGHSKKRATKKMA